MAKWTMGTGKTELHIYENVEPDDTDSGELRAIATGPKAAERIVSALNAAEPPECKYFDGCNVEGGCERTDRHCHRLAEPAPLERIQAMIQRSGLSPEEFARRFNDYVPPTAGLQPALCIRESGHTGPCNGFPRKDCPQ